MKNIDRGKGKTKPYARVVELPVLRRAVVVMHADTLEEARVVLDKALNDIKSETGMKPDISWDEIRKELEPSIGDENTLGFTFVSKGDVYIFLNDNSSAVLVHEAVHAASRILEAIGSTCDELRAYITEYIYLELCHGREHEKGGPKVR